MYYNFKITNLNIEDIWLLQIARQNSTKAFTEILQPYLESKDLSGVSKYITRTREGKIILNKEGKELYEKVTTSHEVEESDVKTMQWLVEQYTAADKIGGNKKKMAYYIAAIRETKNLTPVQLYIVLQHFINDERAFEYSKKAENLLFSPGNAFRTKFSPDESPICQYYDRYEQIFLEKFSNLQA